MTAQCVLRQYKCDLNKMAMHCLHNANAILAIPNIPGTGGGPITNFLLMENGVDFMETENGLDLMIRE